MSFVEQKYAKINLSTKIQTKILFFVYFLW